MNQDVFGKLAELETEIDHLCSLARIMERLMQDGGPPENYLVQQTCRHIAALNELFCCAWPTLCENLS